MEETKRLYSMPSFFFRVSWKAKIHSAKWIRSVDNICCWKKSVSEWGSCRQEKKNEVLYYKGHHWSEILALRSSAEFEKSSKRGCDSMSFKRNGIKDLICCQHLSSDKFHSEQHFQADNAGVISTKPICFQSLEAICWPDTPALSQPSDSVNTKGQKRSSIVLQRLKHWLGVIMIHDTLSLWVIISEASEWTLMVISDHRRDVVTACQVLKCPPLTKEVEDDTEVLSPASQWHFMPVCVCSSAEDNKTAGTDKPFPNHRSCRVVYLWKQPVHSFSSPVIIESGGCISDIFFWSVVVSASLK